MYVASSQAAIQLTPAAAAALPPFPSGFIRAHGTRFVDSECRVFNPVGWNRQCHYLLL